MACQIQYIRDYIKPDGDPLTEEEQKIVANIHYRKFYEAMNDTNFFHVATTDGALMLYAKTSRPEAEAKIKELNDKFRRFSDVRADMITVKENRVTIDLTTAIDTIIEVNEKQASNTLKTAEKIGNKEVLVANLPHARLLELDEISTEKKAQLNYAIYESVAKKIKAALDGVRDVNNNTGSFGAYINHLGELYGAFKEGQHDIQAISTFLSTAVDKVDSLLTEYKTINDKIKVIDTLTEAERTDLVSRMEGIRYILEIYQSFGAMRSQLIEDSSATDVSTMKDRLFDILVSNEIPITIEYQELIDNLDINNPYELKRQLQIDYPNEYVVLSNQIDTASYLYQNGKSDIHKIDIILSKKDKILETFKNNQLELIAGIMFEKAAFMNQQLTARGEQDRVSTKDDVKQWLNVVNSDINQLSYWLSSFGGTTDKFASLYNLFMKDHLENARQEIIQDHEEFLDMFGKISETDALAMSEKYIEDVQVPLTTYDDDGKRTTSWVTKKALVSEINYGQFKQDEAAFYATLDSEALAIQRQQRQDSYGQMFDTIDKIKAKLKAEWYSDHKDIIDNPNELIDTMFKGMPREEFISWLKSNMKEMPERKTKYVKDKDSLINITALNAQLEGLLEDWEIDEIIKTGKAYQYRGEFTMPKRSLYGSATYDAVKNDPVYIFLKKKYDIANLSLPKPDRLRYNVLPQQSTKGGSIFDLKSNIKENVKIKRDANGNAVKDVPIEFTRFIDETDVNLNIINSIFAFKSSAVTYKHISKTEPIARMIVNVVQGDKVLGNEFNGMTGRKVLETNAYGNNIGIQRSKDKLEKQLSLANQLIINNINDYYYGEKDEDTGVIFDSPWITKVQDQIKLKFGVKNQNVSINKVTRSLLTISNWTSMALNINSGIGNVIIGKIGSYAEAVGGRYWNVKDAAWAEKEVAKYFATFEVIKDMFANKDSGGHKYMQLMRHYDAVQGEFMDKNGLKITTGVAGKVFSTDTIFFLQHIGETNLQAQTMLALFKATKLPDGSSLIDAYEVVNDKLQVKPSHQQYVTKEFERGIQNRLHAINKKINGVYNSFDKNELQRHWFGKLMIQYRKHIYPILKDRLSTERYDFELGDISEGTWRVFFAKFLKDLQDLQWEAFSKLVKGEGYTEREAYAMRRTLYDLTLFTFVSIFSAFLMGIEKDDDDWFLWQLTLQMRRLKDNLKLSTPTPYLAGQLTELLNKPSVAVDQVSKYVDFFVMATTEPFGTYSRKSGMFDKGDSKLVAKFIKTFPITKPIYSFMNPQQQVAFYNLPGHN